MDFNEYLQIEEAENRSNNDCINEKEKENNSIEIIKKNDEFKIINYISFPTSSTHSQRCSLKSLFFSNCKNVIF